MRSPHGNSRIADVSILEVSRLSIRIDTENGPVQPVTDVSFTVAAGEVVALVGGSGSGKSLTATAVLGLLPDVASVSGGVIRFRDEDITHQADEGRRALRGRGMAMVFQDPMQYLNPVMTCGDQVSEAMRVIDGMPSGDAAARVRDLFQEVGLPDPPRHARQYPHELSGGMRQRATIAMALACNPALLIADEPTTALDVTIQAQILDLLKRLKSERGMGMLFITHNLGVVAEIADRVAVMYAGSIVETGTVERVFSHPRHPYTQGLMRSAPRIGEATVLKESGKPLPTIAGSVPSLANLPEGCPFAPRCSYSFERCTEAIPALVDMGEAQFSRCIRWQEV